MDTSEPRTDRDALPAQAVGMGVATAPTGTVPGTAAEAGTERAEPPPDSAPGATQAHPWTVRRVLRRTAQVAFWSGIGLAGAAVGLLLLFRFVDPPFTAFTVAHRLSGERVTQVWVPLERISPHLVRAVIASEDAKFCQHFGIDFGEMEAAIERAKDGIPRGASTISMQVIKNLFLWSGKSYVRKAIEIPLTLAMEQMWPKSRILEVYLNIAEWGPGIYGAEAAAQFHFEKPAARLSEREAALLAVSLPNPAERDAGDPGPGTQRLADRIQARVKALGRSTACVEQGVGQR